MSDEFEPSGTTGGVSAFRAHLATVDTSGGDPGGGGDDGEPELVGDGGASSARRDPGRGSMAQRSSEDYVERRDAARKGVDRKPAPEPELEAPEPEQSDVEMDGDDIDPPDDAEEELAQDEEGVEREQRSKPGEPTKAQLMEMHKAIASPNLPEQLMDRLVLCKDGDREYYDTVGNLREGRMRHDRFSRGMQEQARVIGEAQQMMHGLRQQIAMMRQSAETGVGYLRQMLGDKAFDDIVTHRAVQLHQLNELPPQFREMAVENERLRVAQQRFQQEQQQRANQPDPYQQQQALHQSTQFVNAYVPPLFERHGLQLNDHSIKMFSEHLQFHRTQYPDLHQAMEESAKATIAEMKHYAESYYNAQLVQQPNAGRNAARQLKAAVPPQLAVRALPGPAPKAGDRNKRGTRSGGGSASDFSALRKRSMNG
jgi:hypothetical protein